MPQPTHYEGGGGGFLVNKYFEPKGPSVVAEGCSLQQEVIKKRRGNFSS
jgi:hypothetical protein